MKKIILSAFWLLGLQLCIATVIKTDVLIIGGGASGTTAGIQSARQGAKTIITEESSWLGGMLTSAGVSAIDGNHKMPGGLWGEFRDSLALRYGGLEKLATGWVSNTLFEPSVGAKIFANICSKEKNLKVEMQTSFVSAKQSSKGWTVVLQKKKHKIIVKAKVLIDATELGDVAKACGVKYDIGMDARSYSGEDIAGEKSNNIVQDLTYVMILKDYGKNADKTIAKPVSYDPSQFYCACKTEKCIDPKEEKRVWDCDKMLAYGKLPNNKYMINWPIEGNDYYINLVEMTDVERTKALQKAKDFSLSFLYYIQQELGYKHLGLADDEFPTTDKLPFIPYHRESRRIHGKVRFTVNDVAKPYDQVQSLYRTGIAVGDYPVDHHHTRYPNWQDLPDLHFYPVPSYSLPLGTLIPLGVENLIVAEKSISVSNLVNGTTRLQPVVLQIGQAAGALAALAVKEKVKVSEVQVRDVQKEILNAKGYIMPYLDLTVSDRHFKAIQRIGATGILRGEGKNVGWSNQTWFNADSLVLTDELTIGIQEFCGMNIQLSDKTLNIKQSRELVNSLANHFKINELTTEQFKSDWVELGLNDFELNRPITRKELSVIIDNYIPIFNLKRVDITGKFIN